MNKMGLILLAMLFLFFMVGCQPERPLSETLKEADRLIEEIKQSSYEVLGEERHKEIWGEDSDGKKLFPVKLIVNAGSVGEVFEFNVTVNNNSSGTIFVCSSDFTLKMPNGLTINPRASSVHSFEAIELDPKEKTQGYVYFESKDIDNPGVYCLNFNHNSGSQQFLFRK